MSERSTDVAEGEVDAQMRTAVRWILLIAFAAYGTYLILWAYQSASFSVTASSVIAEIYKTQALLALPLGLLTIFMGIVLFILLRRK